MYVWLDPAVHRSNVESLQQNIISVTIYKKDLVKLEHIMDGKTGTIYSSKWKDSHVVLTSYHLQQEYQMFQNCVLDLCKLRHPNLIRVLGICPEMGASVTRNIGPSGGIVLEFFVTKNSLTWKERVKNSSRDCCGTEISSRMSTSMASQKLDTSKPFLFSCKAVGEDQCSETDQRDIRR